MFLSHSILAQVAILFSLVLRASAETHSIKFVNKCGYGYPALIEGGINILTGDTYTSNGAWSGIAYLQTGYCNTNGENCTLLETTLHNPQCAGCGSSTDLSLISPHYFSVTTSFAYYGGCDGQGKTCTSENCVGDAFFQPNDNVVQVACQVNDVNLLVSFCAEAAQFVPGVAVATTDGSSSATSSLPTTSSVPTSSLPASSPPPSSSPSSASSTPGSVPPVTLAASTTPSTTPTPTSTPIPTPTPTPTPTSTDTSGLDCGGTEPPASSTPTETPTNINDSECGGTEPPSSTPTETPSPSQLAVSVPTSTPTSTTPESSALPPASAPASLSPSNVPSCRPRPLTSLSSDPTTPTFTPLATPSISMPAAQFRRHRRASRIRY